jgi:5-methyltetrahydrofolate--homocysteine methyltransferase
VLAEHVVAADDAMGTMLRGCALSLDDFEGYEIRNVTRPDVVREAYFAVGVECVETNT